MTRKFEMLILFAILVSQVSEAASTPEQNGLIQTKNIPLVERCIRDGISITQNEFKEGIDKLKKYTTGCLSDENKLDCVSGGLKEAIKFYQNVSCIILDKLRECIPLKDVSQCLNQSIDSITNRTGLALMSAQTQLLLGAQKVLNSLYSCFSCPNFSFNATCSTDTASVISTSVTSGLKMIYTDFNRDVNVALQDFYNCLGYPYPVPRN